MIILTNNKKCLSSTGMHVCENIFYPRHYYVIVTSEHAGGINKVKDRLNRVSLEHASTE